MTYGSYVYRKPVIEKKPQKTNTETKEKNSCHSIWLLTTSPTTSTRLP